MLIFAKSPLGLALQVDDPSIYVFINCIIFYFSSAILIVYKFNKQEI